MIRTFLFDRGRDARISVIRETNRRLSESAGAENDLVSTVCGTLCAPGGYIHARVIEKRGSGAVRLAGSAGKSPGIADESISGLGIHPGGTSPVPVMIPLRSALAAAFPVPAGDDASMSLLVVAGSKRAYDPAETGDLAALAARLGGAIANLRLAARLDSLKTAYDAQSAALEDEREHSRRLLDLAPLPILQFGPEGEIRIFNRRCETLTGYRAAEALNRRMPDLLIPEALRSDFRRLLVELFIGRRSGSFPFPLQVRSGESIPVFWKTVPIRDESNGKICAILACGETTNASVSP